VPSVVRATIIQFVGGRIGDEAGFAGDARTRVRATTKGAKKEEEEEEEERKNAAEASEAKETRMENTVSGDRRRYGGNERPIEGPVEGRRLAYLPVAGSVGVRQVENPSVASLPSSALAIARASRHENPSIFRGNERQRRGVITPVDIDGTVDFARIIVRGKAGDLARTERSCVVCGKVEEVYARVHRPAPACAAHFHGTRLSPCVCLRMVIRAGCNDTAAEDGERETAI